MQLPQWLARFNRYFTNPIQRLWASWGLWRPLVARMPFERPVLLRRAA